MPVNHSLARKVNTDSEIMRAYVAAMKINGPHRRTKAKPNLQLVAVCHTCARVVNDETHLSYHGAPDEMVDAAIVVESLLHGHLVEIRWRYRTSEIEGTTVALTG